MTSEMWNRGSAGADSSEKRRVLLGVTGSIAAYKAAELARLFVSWGYEVRVIMSEAAQHFITTTTMEVITGQPVATDFWDDSETCGVGHIQLADWADVMVIAPATADTIAKMTIGCADSPLLAVALATKAPILVAPAMNVNMLEHPATQENMEILRERGVSFVDPEEGELACGWKGGGRLAHPWEIFYEVRRKLSVSDFAGRRVLITTGPTREYLDPVRFISNRSSGKMGVALAREAFRRGANVHLIHGQVPVRVPRPVRRTEAVSAIDMHREVMQAAFAETAAPDIVIMSAAVADYRPEKLSDEKLKKTAMGKTLGLTQNPDILADLGKRREEAGKGPVLVGFAVETGELEDLLAEARRKLSDKKADLIVGNFAQEAFDLDTNRAWLVDRHGKQEEIATSYKSRVANKILDAVIKLC